MKKTMFVGDVHGCATELKDLVEKAKADEIILIGDCFTKGPRPKEVWELIKEYDMKSIKGNHEEK